LIVDDHRCSQDFLWSALFVVLKTQAKTAKLTTPILQLSPAQQKFPCKFDFLLHLGVHLQLTPINYAQKIFSALRGALGVLCRRHWKLCFVVGLPYVIAEVMRTRLIVSYDVCLKMIIEERTVVAAKLDRGGRAQPSFRLPLRTRLELHFHGRWKKSVDPASYSRWDCVAEEVNKSVYHAATGH